MEEPNSNKDINYTPVLRLPRNKPPDSTKKKKPNSNTSSPRDTTPIIVNGNTVSREDITPIIDQTVFIPDTIEKIDLIENPSAIHDILENSSQFNPPKILNQIPNNKESPKSTEEQIKSEIELLDTNLEVKNYRKFNPPFPETQKISRPMLGGAYIESVESTDTSTTGSSAQPKITSPTDVFAIDRNVKSQDSIKREREQREQREREQRDREQREREQREREQREREQREWERSQKEQRDREQREKEQREREQREREQREQEQREKKEKLSNEQEQKPLSLEELIGRAHDCYLKYQILQKSWTEYKFPNMDEKLVHSNPQLVIDTYNKSVERIQIDMDVNQYKIALIIMFLVIEVVCVKFLGFDAGGYTLSQIKAMNRYEKLLIEIGEKKMILGGDSWPPEVRILFIGLFNCGLFILMKYLSSVLGPELVGYISPIVNGLFSGALDSSKTANLPDEIPQRQQDMSGMLGGVASLAAKALSGNSAPANNIPNSKPTKASRRPVYRE